MTNESDIRIDVFTAGVNTPCHVKLIHIPTGIVVEATHRSQYRAKLIAMQKLKIELESSCSN
jgi:protein subunit release factor A